MNMKFRYGFYINGSLIQFAAAFNSSPEYYSLLRAALQVKRCNVPLQRVGKSHDGGYLMVPPKTGGIAYSFGISDDVSWDAAMADYGYQIYMYDHTIETLPAQRAEFHFFREEIASNPTDLPPLYPLAHALEVNQHTDQQNMILKMDVEGAEWGFLMYTPSAILSQFDQIVIEFHDLVKPHSRERSSQMLYCLQKMQETHELVHLHANNFGCMVEMDGHIYGDVLEATYVRKELISTEADRELSLPHALDEPNNPDMPEIRLGQWNS
ncbi:hypothetical protein [uncultured Selenomonas sp.]|uniref:hypothetical protein n=1 Tax=uncultured Selenomonas sp. TaxID=159275 RepID=UPI0025FD29F8|nr:hypothetical protein [uncultured Selenomonas sp.]